MRGLLTDVGKIGVRLVDFPDPVPGPGQVLISVKAAGLCGSDQPMYRGYKTPDVVEAGQHVIGHEPAGVVMAVGEGVQELRPGDRVCVYHLTGCGKCYYCQKGLYQYCQTSRIFMGFHLHGGDADLLCCDSRYAVPLADSLSFTDAATAACGGGTAFAALKKLGSIKGMQVVVSGLGPVGLAATILAKAMGARVLGLDRIAERLELGLKSGCEAAVDVRQDDPAAAILAWTGDLGAPVILECSGSPEAQQTAIRSAAVGGRVILIGHNHQLTIDPSDQLIIRREVSLSGSWIFSRADLVDLLAFMHNHQVSFAPMITHCFPLEEAEHAFALFDSGKAGKILLIP